MVSSISKNSKGSVPCPVLDCEISTQRCAEERITTLACPLSCPRNPFNPNSVEQFDRVVARGLEIGMKWISEFVGKSEMSRSLKAMDRRFNPEADLPLVTFENAWRVIDLSRCGKAHQKLWKAFEGKEGKSLRNETRVFIEKMASSRALLLSVLDTPKELPYYKVQDLLDPEQEYLYVDFGVQDPLQVGEVLFGRFFTHENCLYVLPGIFVGSPILGIGVANAVMEFLKVGEDEAHEAIQYSLPEVWELLEEIQFNLEELEGDFAGDSAKGELDTNVNNFRAFVDLPIARDLVLQRLRTCDVLHEEAVAELQVSFVDETIFRIVVNPPQPPMEDDFLAAEEEDLEPLTVGSVVVGDSILTISGENPVELELVRALVVALLSDR